MTPKKWYALSPTIIFLIGAVLCAYRDVMSEVLLKGQGSSAAYTPGYLFFVGCAATLVVSLLWAIPQGSRFFSIPKKPIVILDIFAANLFTFIAFVGYFYSIGSPVGAGVTSVIAFGADPIFTALAARVLQKQKFGFRFYLCVAISIVGIIFIGWQPLRESGDSLWGRGLIFCIASSACYSLYVIFLKRLSNHGLSANQMVFYRFILIVLGGFAYGLYERNFFQPISWQFWVFSVIGYSLSVIAFVYCVSKMTIERIVILGFLIPICTFTAAAFVNRAQYSWIETVGVTLVLSVVILFEWENFKNFRPRGRRIKN